MPVALFPARVTLFSSRRELECRDPFLRAAVRESKAVQESPLSQAGGTAPRMRVGGARARTTSGFFA